VTVSGKGSGRVSVAGLICIKPGQRTRLIYRTITYRRRKGEKKGFGVADFQALLRAAHHQLPGGKIVLVWASLKGHLVNRAVRGVDHLNTVIKTHLKRMQYRPCLLDGIIAATGLTLEPP
jgi:hypothetical protein